jgi:hypothetical protein
VGCPLHWTRISQQKQYSRRLSFPNETVVVHPEFTIRLPGGTTWCRAWVTVPGTDGESTVRFVSSNRSAPRILHDHSPRCYAITGAVYPCTEPPTRPIDAQGGRLVCWVAQDHSQFYTVRRYPRLTPIVTFHKQRPCGIGRYIVVSNAIRIHQSNQSTDLSYLPFDY